MLKKIKKSTIMAASRANFVVLVYALATVTAEILDPLSDEFINLINSKQTSWKAGRNFPLHIPLTYIKNLMGVLKDESFAKLQEVKHEAGLIANLPETYDPRDKWLNCPSLNEIRDQGSCGSCWAHGATEAMTDRYCIHSNGTQQFHFSAEDLMSCCADCGLSCYGGNPVRAWIYWKDVGIVSGGNYNSSQGCRPYEIPSCEHHVPGNLPPCSDKEVPTPKCVKSCESSYNTEYDKDKRHGKSVYGLPSDEEQIRAELFKNGPVGAHLIVYEDFIHYKNGVYKHFKGKDIGNHSVKIIGWGVDGDGTKYWLVANSWNSEWGDKGFFKILRGERHCGIEDGIIAGEPLIE